MSEKTKEEDEIEEERGGEDKFVFGVFDNDLLFPIPRPFLQHTKPWEEGKWQDREGGGEKGKGWWYW